jgi:O-antigen/teichoic acid export membrane protein
LGLATQPFSAGKMKNIKNSIYGVLDSLTSPVLMLFVTPIFLNYLGIEGYAIWVLVNSVIASLSIFNLGGTLVVTKFISAGGGESDTGEVFSTVFLFQSIVVISIYVLFLTIAPIAIKYSSSENLISMIDILYIAIPIFFVKQSEEMLYAFFKGYEQFGHVVNISTISKIVFFSTQALTAIFTKSVFDVFYGALVASILLFFLQAIYVKKIHKNEISFSKANFKTARALLNFSIWNGLSSMAAMLRSQSDKWLVSGLLGLKVFGFYSIGVLVFNQLYNIVGSSVYWIFPEVSKGNSNNEILAKKYWKLLFYVCVTSLGISVFLIEFSFLFQLWLGEEVFQSSKHYINAFLLLFPVFTLSIISSLYLLGLGLVKQGFFVEMISLVAKVVTIWLIIDIFNIAEWVIFFIVFIAIEFIAYAVIISKKLPIKFTHLAVFFLLQVIIVLSRIQITGN